MVAIRSFGALGMLTVVACNRIHEEASSNSTTYCPYVSGFTAYEGKCTGQFVENWANGEYAYYGQDSNGHIYGLSDAARVCSQHYDCSGFYTREGVGYSHYRTGRFEVNPNPGHCCYRKVGGGSNLLEVSEEAFDEAKVVGFAQVSWDRAQDGCYLINDESTCLRSYDGRNGFSNSACAWCCGFDCGNGYRCEPQQWLMGQANHATHYRDGFNPERSRCNGAHGRSIHNHGGPSRPIPAPSPRHHSGLDSYNQGCHLIDSESRCTSSEDGRSGTQFGGQACAWCCGHACVHSESGKCQPEGWLNAQTNRVGGWKTGTGHNGCR